MKVVRLVGAVFAGAMVMATSETAGATVVLDQLSQVQPPVDPTNLYAPSTALAGYADPAIFSGPISDSRLSFAQSITAGVKGRLDHIDFSQLGHYGSGTLVLSLIDGDYATGARTVVGQSIFDLSTIPNYNYNANLFNFTFSTRSFNYHVTNGHKFSVHFDTDPNSNGFVSFNEGYVSLDFSTGSPVVTATYLPNYTGGQLTINADGTDVTGIHDNLDIIFATYVDTSGGVPEPATWALMILGFGGIGAAMRRRTPAMTAAA